MKVLITSPRAPVTIDWVRLALRSNHEVHLTDSLESPLAFFTYEQGLRPIYHKIAGPRYDFKAYAKAMTALIEQMDLVIPTCEDIFYLEQVPLSESNRAKCLMPDKDLIFQLHHKYAIYQIIMNPVGIVYPKTKLLESWTDLDQTQLSSTILKPVFSRFGKEVIRDINNESYEIKPISSSYPWVQQEKINGQNLCSYAICHHGEVVAQVVYQAQYCLNGSASSYFEAYDEPRINAFVCDFVARTNYHGQIAFDFIDNGQDIYLLECNPRATSGLHLLSEGLRIEEAGIRYTETGELPVKSMGKGLYFLFGLQALGQGKIAELMRDKKRSESILKGVPMHHLIAALAEFTKIAAVKKISLTQASTDDIQYDGEAGQKDVTL
ncbi:ATP-grasp domain-containing protein [Streptococcus porcinus]|uniref:ATP-grasp domain protein n=1 Tax=Streptococcus porcinus str. Jelinkova 176 TaxID=873448 RepID=A0ABN0CV00_STRPO|nr:ATP-grasp domain-containing protein [Streptococcus porcinus]EGJ27022.1 ATP-grasp domain protein [Streptococcus porcinus str. Jelinkova 176]SQG43104.1 Predicted ATP-grasp enzyme [Streptococcus porcinus]